MLEITQVALREVRLPLREPFQISSGTMTERRICLLQLKDRSGAEAWSECVAFERPNYSPETIDTAWFMLRKWLVERVLGRGFGSAAEVASVLDADIRGHNMAKAALEMGCWELEAQLRGQPLARTLGGTRDRVATGISLGIEANPEALVAKARTAFEHGYRKIKLKIKPGKDVTYVEAVRAELGSEAHLMADANSAYTPADASHLAQLDAFDLIMIEQPLASDDLVRHAALQTQLRTPLCLDESITSLDRAEDMIALRSGRIINIKPGRVGGFTASIAIHDLAARHAIPVWCGGMLESGIGRAYNVALASLSNFTLPGDLSPSARYWEQDIVLPEWTMDAEGMVDVPSARPGIGVELDTARIEKLTVRSEVIGERK